MYGYSNKNGPRSSYPVALFWTGPVTPCVPPAVAPVRPAGSDGRRDAVASARPVSKDPQAALPDTFAESLLTALTLCACSGFLPASTQPPLRTSPACSVPTFPFRGAGPRPSRGTVPMSRACHVPGMAAKAQGLRDGLPPFRPRTQCQKGCFQPCSRGTCLCPSSRAAVVHPPASIWSTER